MTFWSDARIPKVCQISRHWLTGSVRLVVRLNLRKPGDQYDPSWKMCRLCTKRLGSQILFRFVRFNLTNFSVYLPCRKSG
jgi:hypothetical protein